MFIHTYIHTYIVTYIHRESEPERERERESQGGGERYELAATSPFIPSNAVSAAHLVKPLSSGRGNRRSNT